MLIYSNVLLHNVLFRRMLSLFLFFKSRHCVKVNGELFSLQKEKFHTHLAVLYLERVMSLLSQSPTDEEKLNRARERLQALLRESDLYRVQFLLGEAHV